MPAQLLHGSRILANEIADDLRQLIERGDYAPGAPLRQEEIAARLRVSRIPVREAFRLLEADGIVTVHANRGAFVTEFDADGVAELFDLRLILERDLLTAACPRLTTAELDRIRLIDDQLAGTRSPHEWIALDEAFHFSMYDAANRPQTLALARTLRRSLNSYYLRYLAPGARAAKWQAEHQKLYRAVRRRNMTAAAAALEEHLRGTQAALLAALARPGAAKRGGSP
jgi:DNA-binding GntR family transcriptional regulator